MLPEEDALIPKGTPFQPFRRRNSKKLLSGAVLLILVVFVFSVYKLAHITPVVVDNTIPTIIPDLKSELVLPASVTPATNVVAPAIIPPQRQTTTGCGVAYRFTEQRWIDEQMDTYLSDWIAAHPECNDAEEGWYMCYAETVGYGGFYCLLGSGNCNSEAYCATADTRTYYTFTAMSHLAARYNNLYLGMQYAFSQSLTALPTLTHGLEQKPRDNWFLIKQMISMAEFVLLRFPVVGSLPINMISETIKELIKPSPDKSFSNYATISDAVRHFWQSVLDGVNKSLQDILDDGDLFATVVKNGSFLPNPPSYTSIASVDANFLPLLIEKYIDIFLAQLKFTILNGSDEAFGLGPANCLLNSEANDTWNSWLDPETQNCWVWGVDGQYNQNNLQPFNEIAKFLFVDGNGGLPFTTPEKVVARSVECSKLTIPESLQSNTETDLDTTFASETVNSCSFDFPICNSSNDTGCSVIKKCLFPVPFWPYCFWEK